MQIFRIPVYPSNLMKLQFHKLAPKLLRFSSYSTATAAVKGKKLTSSTVPKSQSNVDISKMPQPLPVLTPLSRSNASTLNDPMPPIENIANSDKTVFRIELEGELQKRLPRTVAETFDHFGGHFYVPRRELIEAARVALEESSRVLLDGPNGSGKSVLLMQMYAAMKESFKSNDQKLVVYLPNVHKWTTGYFPYYPMIEEGAEMVYKQPELALEFLQLLLVCNAAKLPTGLSQEISEASLDAYNRALPLFERTMSELKQEGKEIVIFMDGVNGLIDESSLTGYFDPEGKALPLKSLSFCSQFFKKSALGNNVKIIGAFTHSNPALPKAVDSSAVPTVNVPNYSQDDLKRVLKLYSQLGHASTNKSDQFVAFKSFVSGSNGRKLFKSCEFDSIYYK